MTAPATVRRTVAAPIRTMPLPVKVVVLGGRAVGRSRVDVEDLFVDEVSELPGGGTIMPYGRCTVSGRLAVHVYGMPAQHRYWFMWDNLARGAAAALVLADAHRLADCFSSIDYAAQRGMPYLVAVTNAAGYQVAQLREALMVPDEVPVLAAGSPVDRGGRPRPARDLLHVLIRYVVTRRNATTPA